MNIGCVLLAAGFGSRFGSNKLLVTVDGLPIVHHVLSTLPVGLFSKAVAVSQYPVVLELAKSVGYLPLYHVQPEKGISSSVKLGLSWLIDMEGVLFSVCDQPWLKTKSVQKLLDAFHLHPTSIVALARDGRRGNPVIFPRDLYPELMALTGDTGGGLVIKHHPERLLLVEAEDPRELDDVDKPSDLSC